MGQRCPKSAWKWKWDLFFAWTHSNHFVEVNGDKNQG